MALRELLKINTSWDGQETQLINRKNEVDSKKENKSTNESDTINDNIKTETDADTTNSEIKEKVKDNNEETEDSKVNVKNVPVVTQGKIPAKQEFIQKEIDVLEDEIWSYVGNDNMKVENCKRKNENTSDIDVKKVKTE